MDFNNNDMIVVHPYDPSTLMLKKVYEGLDNVTQFDSWKQRREILKAIAEAPREEPILSPFRGYH